MNRTPETDRGVLLCLLVAAMRAEKSWAGETHIQKSVMFLQKLLDVPLGYQFVLYKHGPFSFDLRSELAIMRTRLQLGVEPHIGYGPTFTLGQWGEWAVKKPTAYDSEIEFVATKISTKDTRLLEGFSTAFFLKDKYPERTNFQIAEEINRLKPHISIKQAIQAIEDAKQLRVGVACQEEN